MSYQRDTLGRIVQVSTTTNGQEQLIATAIQYRGDGLLTALTYGNGIQETRNYDEAGRLNCITTDRQPDRCYQYDANGNIIQQQSEQSHDYAYDVLDRLFGEDSDYRSWRYRYDENGNRLSKSDNQTIEDYRYQADSNRLMQIDQQTIERDAAGNTISDQNGKRTFAYNQQGRLESVIKNRQLKASYLYNALGQRTQKHPGGDANKAIIYHYDQTGQLLAESHSNPSKAGKDYIWLDNRPMAQLSTKQTKKGKTKTGQMIYLHTDHLNTPRVGTDKEAEIIWRWESDAFGNDLKTAQETEWNGQEDDDEGGHSKTERHTTFKPSKVNLRFPGQYYDRESGLYYNWFRYYDPGTGRYITSDPIGLDGGLNTFGYTLQNPIVFIDFDGRVSKKQMHILEIIEKIIHGIEFTEKYHHVQERIREPGLQRLKQLQEQMRLEQNVVDWNTEQRTDCFINCQSHFIDNPCYDLQSCLDKCRASYNPFISNAQSRINELHLQISRLKKWLE